MGGALRRDSTPPNTRPDPSACLSLGRFINKDPIEEEGGLNLYAFCLNNGVNRWDNLGMRIDTAPQKLEYMDGGTDSMQDSGLILLQAQIQAMQSLSNWDKQRAADEADEIIAKAIKEGHQAVVTDTDGNKFVITPSNFKVDAAVPSGSSGAANGGEGVGLKTKFTVNIPPTDYLGEAPNSTAGATWSDALGRFVDWATGEAPEHQSFGPGTPQTRDMMNAPGVQRAREFFYNKNAGNGPGQQQSVENYRAGFGLKGLMESGLNPTQQFVGNYRVDIYPNPDGTLTFQLNNNTSMKSFLYGFGPDWEQSTFQPGGNYRQTYFWTEPNKNVPQAGGKSSGGGGN